MVHIRDVAMRHVPRYMLRGPGEVGATVKLDESDSHHLTRVMRRRVGDALELIDGHGGIWEAILSEAGPLASATLIAHRDGPPAPRVVLAVGITEAGRLDLVVEKATELGVGQIVVFSSARARRIPDADAWTRRFARFTRVAEAAARQSGRAALPQLRGVVPFHEVIEEIPHGAGLIIDPRGDLSLTQALAGPAARAQSAHLLVGPEAGFSGEELAAALDHGITAASIGFAILRTETAAIASVALALSARGAMEPRVESKEAISPT
jgi:16S rRNA (uracil1498-N3)-methyltransferase